jgi:hypothetical protein
MKRLLFLVVFVMSVTGFSQDKKTTEANTMLWQAAWTGDVELAKKAVAQGVDVYNFSIRIEPKSGNNSFGNPDAKPYERNYQFPHQVLNVMSAINNPWMNSEIYKIFINEAIKNAKSDRDLLKDLQVLKKTLTERYAGQVAGLKALEQTVLPKEHPLYIAEANEINKKAVNQFKKDLENGAAVIRTTIDAYNKIARKIGVLEEDKPEEEIRRTH